MYFVSHVQNKEVNRMHTSNANSVLNCALGSPCFFTHGVRTFFSNIEHFKNIMLWIQAWFVFICSFWALDPPQTIGTSLEIPIAPRTCPVRGWKGVLCPKHFVIRVLVPLFYFFLSINVARAGLEEQATRNYLCVCIGTLYFMQFSILGSAANAVVAPSPLPSRPILTQSMSPL